MKGSAPEQRLPGDLVVWLLVLAELLTFALLFVSFAVARRVQPEVFAAGQATLDIGHGLANTLALVAASAFAAAAVRAHRFHRHGAWQWWACALLAALAFLGMKSLEFAGRFRAGFDWADSTFNMLYFMLTGFHYLHVVVGCLVFVAMIRGARSGRYSAQFIRTPESAAVFWHMVDLLWMVLFPLVYIIR
ncbi:cytochrome c oxidase subunit 3 [Hydrogenophaga sp. 5NK40-0174]|uniref:cytochrome c oxidase subunit 3 n=1 Tax=Hydrogenophaga sp. 5NK40-0174 TaxID=3127649 RepID=UPI00310A93FB